MGKRFVNTKTEEKERVGGKKRVGELPGACRQVRPEGRGLAWALVEAWWGDEWVGGRVEQSEDVTVWRRGALSSKEMGGVAWNGSNRYTWTFVVRSV